nr:MAG TPA: hypothetical protein [Bacteriophage sp.]
MFLKPLRISSLCFYSSNSYFSSILSRYCFRNCRRPRSIGSLSRPSSIRNIVILS